MKPYRSMLFVPGHKPPWVAKALRSGAHALILDLEDAVPESAKDRAREAVSDVIRHLGWGRVGVFVRVNALDTEHFAKDVAAVVHPGLTGLLLPKVDGRDDVVAYDALVTAAEIERGMPRGGVGLVPCLETARSISAVDAIATGPRVTSLMAAAARDADVSRDVGFRWTPTGEETLYLRSRIVLAARAAGLRHIVLGLWQDVDDLAGLRAFARSNSGLGFGGQVLIHPSHVEVVNEEYAIGDAERDRLRRLVETYEHAAGSGQGAVRFEGDHIDLAHVRHARDLLAASHVDEEVEAL
ncbi:HpcH/HpaI aldolase/citrate lyase family protein [Embleya hyalina]|uniref:Citrate lyase subunit beta n=1 Tax=Embleya hyalina TaxID=516124 RepID=A0A401YQW5_9ACTN|nr:CoA ester lyase [Embleya hyalina]GCD96986.1 citrate lyase subunit beta [Embleya hyalina]